MLAMVVAVVVVGGLVALAPAGAAVDDAGGPAPVGRQGLVDTLAGPGYCPQAGRPVAGSRKPRAVAVGGQGEVVAETGPPDRAVMARVTSQGRVTSRQTRIPAVRVAKPAPESVADTPPGAGRVVAGGHGAVIVAAGTRIERVDAEGVATTLAGDPTGELGGVGSRQVDGPAGTARFRSATSLARDDAGNLFIADHGGVERAVGVVRFFNRSQTPVTFYAGGPGEVTVAAGEVATIAGGRPDRPTPAGATPAGGDRPRAAHARFHGNTTLAVDGDALYVASARARDDARGQVAMINLGGDVLSRHGQTVAPGELAVVAGAGSATIEAAGGITAAGGRVVVADAGGHGVYRLGQQGLEVIAGAEGVGANVGGFNGNRRPAVGARLDRPVDVALADNQTVYVADRGNAQVRAITGDAIRGLAGNGVGLAWQCESDAAAAGRARRQTGGPAAVAVADGVAYVALADASQIVARHQSGKIATVAGDGELDTPTALAVGGDSDALYVYDGGNARLWLVNLSDKPLSAHGVSVAAGAVAAIAGGDRPASRQPGPLGAVATASLVELGADAAAGQGRRIPTTSLGDVAVDPTGGVIVAQPRQHADGGAFAPDRHAAEAARHGRVSHIGADGEVTTLVGETAGACCPDPAAIAVTRNRLYIADVATRQVWLKNRTSQPLTAHGQHVAPGAVAVVAGTGQKGFTARADTATRASLLSPAGLALSDTNQLYIAHLGITDQGPFGHYLHQLAGDGTLTIVAGTGQPAYNGDLRPPRVTAINLPSDLTLDGCGNLLVADAGNDRLRRINFTGACPHHTTPTPTSDSGDGLPLAGLAALTGGLTLLAAAGWTWHHRRRHQ
jgi:sugar lactone lactonase YvrE